MDMVPWHPFRNMERMRRSIDRAFAEPFGNWGALPETWRMSFPVEVLEREGVRHTERFYGSFARTVAFPQPVDSAQARASFRNGLLEITATKAAN